MRGPGVLYMWPQLWSYEAKAQLRVVFLFVFHDFQAGCQKLGISVLTNFNTGNYVLLN